MNKVSPKTKRHKNLFIFGCPRSGTTLMASIVNDNEDYATYYAETQLLNYQHTYGQPCKKEQ